MKTEATHRTRGIPRVFPSLEGGFCSLCGQSAKDSNLPTGEFAGHVGGLHHFRGPVGGDTVGLPSVTTEASPDSTGETTGVSTAYLFLGLMSLAVLFVSALLTI